MSPPPLGPHNRSQTHLKLSRRLHLLALVSGDLHTTNSLKLSGTWTFLSLKLPTHAKASSQGQTLMHVEASQEKRPNSLKKSDFKLK